MPAKNDVEKAPKASADCDLRTLLSPLGALLLEQFQGVL